MGETSVTIMASDSASLAKRATRMPMPTGVAQSGSMLTGPIRMPEHRARVQLIDSSFQVRIFGLPPCWLAPTMMRLAELSFLPARWDSYSARPIQGSLIEAVAKQLITLMPNDIPAPSVVPTTPGGVQFEWHMHGIDLEIEIRSDFRWLSSYEDSSTGESWESEGDGGRLRGALRELARRSTR